MSKRKKTINHYTQVRELTEKREAAKDALLDIYDLAEREKRELTEEEQKKADALARDVQNYDQRLRALTLDVERLNPGIRETAAQIIAQNVREKHQTEIIFVRDMMMVEDAASGGLVPLNVQDILEPLTEGLILHKLGLPMPTGLHGEFVWPMYEMAEATVLGEGVELSDSEIPFSKLTAAPERISVAYSVTNQAITQTNGVIEMVVRDVLPKSVALLLNRILLSRSKVNGATNLAGPFADAVSMPVKLSAEPTAKELNTLMKARVLSSGIEGSALCWTMTKAMAAILEVTPISKDGIFIPMIQNEKLLGLPVYTSNEMCDVEKTYMKYSGTDFTAYTLAEGDKIAGSVTDVKEIASPVKNAIYEVRSVTEYVGLGDWRYQPMGLFGSIRFTVDPYSKARKDAVDFVLNCDYATKTLRPEAFCLGQVGKGA